MKTKEQQIFDNTHYGVEVYAYLLNQYSQGQSVVNLIDGEFKTTRNLYNENKEPPVVKIINGYPTHKDLEGTIIPDGNVFDFMLLHFSIERQAIYDKPKIPLVTLSDLPKRGMIKSYLIGGRVLFKESEIEKSLHQVRTVKY